jgi:predicted subunit of tRNA(5-methylaminomethyl-2-thiouridylate) methyltransferase
MQAKIKRQPRVKGGRARLAPSVLHEIDWEVSKTAAKFGVSKSWVIAVALAEVMGIKTQADYHEVRKLRRVK